MVVKPEHEGQFSYWDLARRYDRNLLGVKGSRLRQAEVQQVLEMVRDTPVVVQDNLRMGKTTLAFSCMEAYGEDVSVYIDARGYINSSDEPGAWFGLYEVAEYIARHETANWESLPYRDQSGKKDEQRSRLEATGMNALEYLSRYSVDSGQRVLVILDEISYFADKRSSLEYLAQVSQLDGLHTVLIAHREKEDTLQREILGVFPFLHLGPLREDDFAQLITAPLKGTPVFLDEGAVAEIAWLAGNRPMEALNLTRLLFDHAHERGELKLLWTRQDIQEIFAQMDRWMEQRINVINSTILFSGYDRTYSEVLSEVARETLDQMIPQGEKWALRSDDTVVLTVGIRGKNIGRKRRLRNGLQELQEMGWVVYDTEADMFRINGGLLLGALSGTLGWLSTNRMWKIRSRSLF